jgi:NhaA family Na+:H+ antiporter
MRFLRIEAVAGAALLLSTVVAMVLANTGWSASFLALWHQPVGLTFAGATFERSLQHWINDGLMTLFFFLIALELKRELVLGELRKRRHIVLPFAAAVGGMVIPAGFFLLLASGPEADRGWGTVMSTDTAFVAGCLALLGRRVPPSLRVFLLSLAIFDDIGAILVVAIGFGEALDWVLVGAAGAGFLAVAITSRLGVRSLPVYFAAGLALWVTIDAAGLHPTLVGVVLGLMTPARSWVSERRLRAIFSHVTERLPGEAWADDRASRRDLRQASTAARETLSPVERLEFGLHPWVALLVMPLFALANAGVPLSSAGYEAALTPAIFLAFLLGKPLGVFGFAWLAVRLRAAHLPHDLGWPVLAGGSLLTGIGFTMALFIAELAFAPAQLTVVKPAIMAASVLAAAAGLSALAWRAPRSSTSRR